MTKIRYTNQELQQLARYLCAKFGRDVLVNNQLIIKAQKAILSEDRHKQNNYNLVSRLTTIIKGLDDVEVNLFDSTKSLYEHGVLDKRNGHIAFQPDVKEVVIVQPLPKSPLTREHKLRIDIEPTPQPHVNLLAESPADLLTTLVEVNHLVIKLYQTSIGKLSRISDLDKRRLRNLCIQATNGLSNFEEFL